MSLISFLGDLFASNSDKNAVNDAHNSNDAIFKQVYGDAQKNYGGFLQNGQDAGNALQGALGLGSPDQFNSAFAKYLDSTGYNFQLQQGGDAIDSNAASSHLLHSGANLKNLSNYGQQMGKNYFQTYLGNLQGQQQVGMQAAGGIAGAGQNYATNSSQNNWNQAEGLINGNNSLNAGFQNWYNELNKMGAYAAGGAGGGGGGLSGASVASGFGG